MSPGHSVLHTSAHQLQSSADNWPTDSCTCTSHFPSLVIYTFSFPSCRACGYENVRLKAEETHTWASRHHLSLMVAYHKLRTGLQIPSRP